MFSRLRGLFARRSKRSEPPPVIEATADGFVLRRSDGTAEEVSWSAVRRVHAYKRDLLTTDEIRLLLELEPPGGLLELSEEWPGFEDLFGGMERALGVSPAWYPEIMLPAFAPTPRTLYPRADTPTAGADPSSGQPPPS
jgi:hypothetical protein